MSSQLDCQLHEGRVGHLLGTVGFCLPSTLLLTWETLNKVDEWIINDFVKSKKGSNECGEQALLNYLFP